MSRKKRPLQLQTLSVILLQMDLSTQLKLYLAVLIMTAHDGLLRVSELLSDLKVADLLWTSGCSGFKIHLRRSKQGRSGPGVYIAFNNYGNISAVKLMIKWYEFNNLWNSPEKRIFPRRTKGRQLSFSATAPKGWFRSKLKELVKRVGLHAPSYSTHSLRAGGATDLFVARVPYYIIKKMGRWTFDVAIENFRNEDNVEEEVHKAFSGLVSPK
jgi:hypothetical protein